MSFLRNTLRDPTDTSHWGELRDPEIIRVKIDGKNIYQVWMDYAKIDEFKTRAPAKRLVKWLEDN